MAYASAGCGGGTAPSIESVTRTFLTRGVALEGVPQTVLGLDLTATSPVTAVLFHRESGAIPDGACLAGCSAPFAWSVDVVFTGSSENAARLATEWAKSRDRSSDRFKHFDIVVGRIVALYWADPTQASGAANVRAAMDDIRRQSR